MQHDHSEHHTPAAEQPQLAQVRLEADMLRGAVAAAGLQSVVNAVRRFTVGRRVKQAG